MRLDPLDPLSRGKEPFREVATSPEPEAPTDAAPEVEEALTVTSDLAAMAEPPTESAMSTTSDEAYPRSNVSAAAGLKYFRLNSHDKSSGTTATLLSDLSPEFNLGWSLDWTADWTTTLAFGLTTYRILDDVGPSQRSIENSSGSSYRLALEVARTWSPRSLTALSIGMEERLFEHSSTVDALTIDEVVTPVLELSHELEIYRVRSASFSAEASGEVLLPGSGPGYTTETGYGAEISLRLAHETRAFTVEAEIYYGMSEQDSSLVEQSEAETGARLGLTWDLGG
ncbi:MAG: hypothetical protein HC902_14430 [Calothrix sp. SM1_5_4]|nr:hypothetical protein [Calothrix sp. SM1_5_4]